jgi:hypothetical protein
MAAENRTDQLEEGRRESASVSGRQRDTAHFVVVEPVTRVAVAPEGA